MTAEYVLIFTHDSGANWQAAGAYMDRDTALKDMHAYMAANPARRYEMHPIHPNLYAALTAEKPTIESFF